MNVPRWAQTKLPKPGTKAFRSIIGEGTLADEIDGRRRLASGSLGAPYDVANEMWLIDERKPPLSHAINRKKLEALTTRALQEGRRPAYLVVFWNGDERTDGWVLIRQQDWQTQE